MPAQKPSSFSLPQRLNIISYLSPNFFGFYEAVGDYLSRWFQIPVQVQQSWANPLTDLRDKNLLDSDVDLVFVCGLPLILACHARPGRLRAIAAPVMQAERYQNLPVYFSDLVVSAASPVTQFEQLAGQRFCFNDLGSNSGYNLMRHRLMQANCPLPFFGDVVQSGSHQQSIRRIIEQQADCAAIDSVVLERQSADAAQLRVIESFGPHPMPPLAAAQRLGPFLDLLQAALLDPDAVLIEQMQQVGIRRFATVQTDDYEPLYQIYSQASSSAYAVIR